MLTVKLLVGNIASGKSSYCAREALKGTIVINDDAIVSMLHGGHYDLYKENLKGLYKGVEIAALTLALNHGKSVIIDRPNGTPAARRKYIGIAHSLGAKVIAVKFPILANPSDNAWRRTRSDPRGHKLSHWIDVATEYAKNYVEPSLNEGFDKIILSNEE